MSSPEIRKAMVSKFTREKGDAGGPREAATLIHRDMTITQTELKNRAVAAGITLYSVAGSGQNVAGHVGTVAPVTGGFVFPMNSGLEQNFGQAIQMFGSRYLLQWNEDSSPTGTVSMDISTTRKGVKLVGQTLR